MRCDRRSTRMMGCLLLLSLLVACATPAPTATPVPPTPTLAPPTATAVPAEVWDYVALGSWAESSTFPDLYAAHIEQDLGVEVNVRNLGKRAEMTGTLLWRLGRDEELRAAVSQAEVVTLWTETKTLYYSLTKGLTPRESELEVFKESFGPLVAEILALRANQKTIVRLLGYYNWVRLAKENGVYEDTLPCLQAFNQHVLDVGSQYGVPVAPVWIAFNGPNGDEDPGDKGYLDWEGAFLGPKGDAVIADLLRSMGYAWTIQ